MKKAFTLIELLVVIAIIAILAAILFPVFAQAKAAAKKTQTLSNFKQYGTSTAIYETDSDDNFPLAWSWDGANWRDTFLTSVPNGWRNNGTHNVEPRKSQDGLFWANSLQQYIKNNQLGEINGAPTVQVVADSVVPGMTKTKVGISFNGLLHAYSATAIEQPSKIPVFWAGGGNQNRDGFGLTNPAMPCAAANAGAGCRFDPMGGPGAEWFGLASIYVYGNGMHFVAADTSAKFRNIKTSTNSAAPSTDYYNNPFSVVDAANTPQGMWFCSLTGATQSYPCVFRPDQTN